MNQSELSKLIVDWKVKHPNPYNNGIEEKVYWHMDSLYMILQTPNLPDSVLEQCEKMFNRFKYYY